MEIPFRAVRKGLLASGLLYTLLSDLSVRNLISQKLLLPTDGSFGHFRLLSANYSFCHTRYSLQFCWYDIPTADLKSPSALLPSLSRPSAECIKLAGNYTELHRVFLYLSLFVLSFSPGLGELRSADNY